MIHTATFSFLIGADLIEGATMRYALLERLREAFDERNVDLLAFGVGGEDLRVLVRGEEGAIGRALRGVKSGTARQVRNQGGALVFSDVVIEPVVDVGAAVDWAHAAGGLDPIRNPWTSLRDMLGLRDAAFYSPLAISELMDVEALRVAWDVPLAPAPVVPRLRTRAIASLFQVAASLKGVLPADRCTFRLIAHLGRAMGFAVDTLADALCVTARRVRQLLADGEPMMAAAVWTLSDPRLSEVV